MYMVYVTSDSCWKIYDFFSLLIPEYNFDLAFLEKCKAKAKVNV